MENLGRMWDYDAEENNPRKFMVMKVEESTEICQCYGEVFAFDTEKEWDEYKEAHREEDIVGLYGVAILKWIVDQGGIYFGEVPMEEI